MAESRQATYYANDEQRWQAVVARDTAADGQFFYSVASTGVYCKPSCAARLPKRDNVAFHESGAAAERAGFRACMRCKPNEPDLLQRQHKIIEHVCRLIEQSETSLNLDALAQHAGMSRFHFQRTFKKVLGITPKQFQQTLRVNRTQHALRHEQRVTDAIYAAGFNSSSHFYSDADKMLGMKAQQFKRGGADLVIRYGTSPCALGELIIAATDKGICSIELGDCAQDLIDTLRQRFPHAQLEAMNAHIEQWLRELVQFIERPDDVSQNKALQLPLDIQGTAFQRQVWQVLQTIPLGTTASYTDIAARIGKPNAARAVATACASNTLALAIPCHRVIRGNGDLAGYRWGIERKRELLQREAEQQPAIFDNSHSPHSQSES